MGGDSPVLIHRTVSEISTDKIHNVYLGTESIREYWMIQYAIELLGVERFIFGSDYNLGHPKMSIEVIHALQLKESDAQAIFYRNLLGLLPPTHQERITRFSLF
jgi:predicted TIM-barrel fold metal-dependent hydrolase